MGPGGPEGKEPVHLMSQIVTLAAEGGYQVFNLAGGEWFWLILSAATAILAIVIGFVLRQGVLAADEGTPTMIEIARSIQVGAMAYLRRRRSRCGGEWFDADSG